MKAVVAAISAIVVLALCAAPAAAREAIFANNVLTIDAVQVGTDTYAVELTPVANVTPLTFTLTKAAKTAPASSYAATFTGTTLTVPNALINGSMRVNAKLNLIGQNPFRFQLSSYSVLRAVQLDTLGQNLSPGRVFSIKYTGGVLAADKISLRLGNMTLSSSVLNDVISASVPANISGSQQLAVVLDGDSFQLPMAIAAGVGIVSPKPYINNYVNEVTAGLRSLGLPSSVLDTAAIASQLSALSEADATTAALQIRENLEPLLAQVNDLLGSNQAVGLSAYALTLSSDAECDRWMKRFTAASLTAGAGVWMTVAGSAGGPAGILVGSIGVASVVVATEVAIRNMRLIVDYCGALNDATFTQALVQSRIVLANPIEIYESRARSFKLTELFQLRSGVRSVYLSTATGLKSTISSALAIATRLGLSSTGSVISSLNTMAAAIVTNDTSSISTDGHKFSIRAISDASISGSTVSAVPGSLTLLFDKKNEDLADGKSMTFTVELYNQTDDISITVPVKLNGASLLEDLKDAMLGRWTVTAYEGSVVLDLEFRAGGRGAYLFPLTAEDSQSGEGGYCKKKGTAPGTSGVQVGSNCEYPLTWSITRNGNAYELNEDKLWIHDGCCAITKSPLALPLNRVVFYGNGTPLRTYVKK